VRYLQQEVRVGCCTDVIYLTFPISVVLMTWLHLCVALDLVGGWYTFRREMPHWLPDL
ncbi:hypothetical protein Pcinc_014652, partial [Petrolisthes cinctipes]